MKIATKEGNNIKRKPTNSKIFSKVLQYGFTRKLFIELLVKVGRGAGRRKLRKKEGSNKKERKPVLNKFH